MDFLARRIQRKKVTHAILVGAFTIATSLTAAVWSAWAGLLGVISFTVLILTLLKPSWFFTAIYPPFIIVGQVPLTIGTTTISLERALVIVGGIGLVGGLFVAKRLRTDSVSKSVFLGTLIFLVAYLLAMILRPAEYGSVIVLGFYQKAILGYFVFISFREPEELWTALKLFLTASFIASLFTLWVYFEEGTLATIRLSSYGADDLSFETSLFRGLARAGAGNTMALWVAICMLWQTRRREGRVFWTGLILWFGVLSLFALRRETLVTIAVGLVWLVWRHPGRHRRYTILASLLMVVGLWFFIMVSPEWMDRLMGETVDEFSYATDPRMALLFRFTPAAFMESPLIGYGPGNYEATQFQFSETLPSLLLQLGGLAPHNSWSGVVIEAGAGALIGFCMLLWGVGRPLFKSLKTQATMAIALWNIAPLLFLQLIMSLFFGDALKLTVTWFWFGFLLALERMLDKPTI